ncbi:MULTISPECIES: TIGR01777 family oxidoreductase [unclassified Prochlorococcus]|uniref:TIGR01777 family oxidoreductase n=1 Tax=unclassified Prochlorococcus TaxID=2627481 RepID=UPI000533ADF2|nr:MULTISPECIES: TIGR01777 family oxidoreductase [unclassified Prochlorococcus]KGG16817.1 Cell division inhibitor [Prochlorococcus sp. MIT 0602]KGG18209.1 Cell division inhibitor [Prochlorococcus sp. MIT 0603]
MRLLLLGCSGFIGSELVPKLLKSGHQLTIVSRKEKEKLKFYCANNESTFIKSNPTLHSSWEKGALMDALINAEGVINLAGEPIANKRWSKKNCQAIKSSRLKTTSYLIHAMSKLKTPPQILVNGSAIGFYGTSSDSIFTERSRAGTDFLAELCAEWEDNSLKKPMQTRLVIIRTGIVLEKDGGALGKMLPIFKAGFGGPIGNGEQWMSWIHRSDLCNMIENALINRNWEGVFNGVSPNPVTMSKFCETLGKTLNRPTLLPVPELILKLLLGDGAKVVLEGQRVDSERLSTVAFKFTYPMLNEALSAITIAS